MSVRRLRARLDLDKRGDRGAVAVLFALLLGSGVLLGMAALVVDVGNIYVEREQLQSGADAGVVKVAWVCATDPATCTASATDLARRYANDNGRDGAAGVDVVCGRGGGLAGCSVPSGGITDCVTAAPTAGNYIEIHTSTRLPDGSTVLPPVFAEAVVSGYRGPTVSTCARAQWGPPGSARSALAISICDWNSGTAGGTSFPDPPVEQVIAFNDYSAGPCQPGGPFSGFGWLDDPNGDCGTPVEVNGAYRNDPGTDVSQACKDMLNGLPAGQPILVPVYGAVAVEGGHATYTVLGVAAFVVTGWNLPGSNRVSNTGRSSCDGTATCIFGYFIQSTLPGGGPTGGPDLGASIVGLVG